MPQCRDTLELLSVEISLHHCKFLLILYYCPPLHHSWRPVPSGIVSWDHPSNSTLFSYLSRWRDFNINHLSPNHTSHQLSYLTSKMNFTQVVQQSNRNFNNSSSLIDHVYLNDPEFLEYCYNPSTRLFWSQLYPCIHKTPSLFHEPQATYHLGIQPHIIWYSQQSPLPNSIWSSTAQWHRLF